MSVSIFWQPVSPKRHPVNGTSSFVDAIRVAFGERDILDQDDVPVLRGMAAAGGFGGAGAKDLLDALEKHDSIRLIFEWQVVTVTGDRENRSV